MNPVKVIKGDITKLQVDAIVNAANSELRGGGGVDGAIHLAGGSEIMDACRKIGGCPTGEAVITTAGNLPAKFVIHTVGPVWNGGNNQEKELLSNAYKNSLKLALDTNLNSVAFPNISTGVYGFPKDLAAKIAINVVKDYVSETGIDLEVTFVCFDNENYNLYNEILND